MPSVTFDAASLRLAAVASSDGAIITQDLTGTITSWNRAAEQIFGHSATQAVGQSIRLIVPPELEEENDEMLRRIKAGESLDHYDTVRVRKDGQRLDVSLTVSPLATAGGEVVGASQMARSDRGPTPGGAARCGGPPERDLQQRQLFEHRYRREGRDPDLQRRRRANAGLPRPPT